jgi:AcrR family transcriptional regulator
MKISTEQKEENRRRIISAAVDLITEKGVKATTMRAVAREAGMGDATIYNYFPTKESILFGYYGQALETGVSALKGITDFNQYDLKEQIQALFETLLEHFLPDREFVAESFPSIFFTLTPAHRQIQSIQDRFIQVLDDMFRAAVEVEEVSEQVFKELVYHVLWDFFVGTVLYWLKDDSEQFTNTTVFIDKSLDLGYALLRAGVVNKMVDISSFLFKTHVLNRMGLIRSRLDTLDRIKREFMAGETEKRHS